MRAGLRKSPVFRSCALLNVNERLARASTRISLTFLYRAHTHTGYDERIFITKQSGSKIFENEWSSVPARESLRCCEPNDEWWGPPRAIKKAVFTKDRVLICLLFYFLHVLTLMRLYLFFFFFITKIVVIYNFRNRCLPPRRTELAPSHRRQLPSVSISTNKKVI